MFNTEACFRKKLVLKLTTATCLKMLSVWGWWDTGLGLNLNVLYHLHFRRKIRASSHHGCSMEISAESCKGVFMHSVNDFPHPGGGRPTFLTSDQIASIVSDRWWWENKLDFWETSTLCEMKLKQKTLHYSKGKWWVFMDVGYILWNRQELGEIGKGVF